MTNPADLVIRLLCWALTSALLIAVARPFHLVPGHSFEDTLFRVAFGLVAGLLMGIAFEVAAQRLRPARARHDRRQP